MLNAEHPAGNMERIHVISIYLPEKEVNAET